MDILNDVFYNWFQIVPLEAFFVFLGMFGASVFVFLFVEKFLQ